MTSEEQMAYGLLAVAGNEALLKPKLDELIKRREDAEAAEAAIQVEREKLEKLTSDTNLHVAQKTEELNTAQKEHDAAADEAHKRIVLAREQDEMLTRKADALDRREKDVTAREEAIKKSIADIARREELLHTHEAEVQVLQNSLAEKHERLKEILS